MGQSAEPRTAVVGGGVVGLLTAWQLRLGGHAVTIFDPAPGGDASYAAAGMLAPISEVQYGQQQLWELMTAAGAQYPEMIAQLERATSEPAGYRENGTLQIAVDPGDRAAVADLVAVQQSHGMRVNPLTSAVMRRREPALSPGLAKAWEIPGDHQVNPRQLVRCVTEALNARLDAGHFPGAGPAAQWVAARVTHVEQDSGGGVRLECAPPRRAGSRDNGAPAAASEHAAAGVFDRAVVVPGLGYGQITGLPQRHRLPLRPVYGDVIRLRVRGAQLGPGDKHIIAATIRARVAGRSVYMVPRAPDDPLEPRGLVVGASSREDGLAGTHAGSVAQLLEDAVAVLPAVREMELAQITTRARPGTPDDRPYLGPLTDDGAVVVSTGFHRHGILLAPLAARLTAALLRGNRIADDDAAHLAAMNPGRETTP
ncbi:FAD-dependent oxidoreductase [Nesterenkonia muleiensis]|uniref:FAD-dependent oxidoreductase n=1 Tax=Nesterenkonia muleiensis TaxID=2282648 RepID=UPI000E7327AD|nr:FAD-dependent oxidoreductase [Nesterenkonia muleiensis]